MLSFYKSMRLYDLEASSESHLREDVGAVSVVIIVLLIIGGNVGTSHYRARSWAGLVLAAPLASITGTGRIKLGEISNSGMQNQRTYSAIRCSYFAIAFPFKLWFDTQV